MPFIKSIPRKIWLVIAAILGLLGIYAKGRSDANAKRDKRDAKAYRETRELIDDAISTDADPAAARDRLRKLADKR